MKTYEEFTDRNFLEIAETIQQRRYQMLIHSCIYYELDDNIISDKKWDEWARELRDLQNKYPDISARVTLYEYFKDWDASTGAFLPITEQWVIDKALLFVHPMKKEKVAREVKPVKKKSAKKRLF